MGVFPASQPLEIFVANPEIILLTKVVEDGNFKILQDNEIDQSFFTTMAGRAVYTYLHQRFHDRDNWGSVPSMDLVRHVVRDFEPVHTTDHIEQLVRIVTEERTRAELLQLSEEVQELAEDGSIETAIYRLLEKSEKFTRATSGSRDLDLAQHAGVIRERYDIVSDGQGIIGIPTPWAPLTEETLGWQPGQLILIYGRPGTMKTWSALNVAIHAYLYANARVLIYSREMTEEEILMRCAALIAEVDYGPFRKGRLQPAMEEQVFNILEGLVQDEEIIAETTGMRKCLKVTTAADLPRHGHTVEGIRAKAEEYKADIVIADGIYRMGDIRTGKQSIEWQSLTHVVQDLKELAKRLRVPIIGVTQANKQQDLAFADAFLQEADLTLRIILNDEDHELVWVCPKIREGELRAFTTHAYPASNFSLKAELDAEEAIRLKNLDDQGKDPKGKKKGGGRGGDKDDDGRSSPRVTRKAFRG